MTRLERFFFRDLLPGSISGDATIRAIADALDPLFAFIIRSIPNLLIWHRLAVTAGRPVPGMLPPIARLVAAAGGLTPLSTAELELLAWQFHVDFREVARTDAELAGMVLDSIPWHRIKGTPASIRRALALFGYEAEIEEDGTGALWATWQLGLPALVDVETVRRISSIVNEMQPARCRLWRIYTGVYDWRPGIWSGGGIRNAWDECWWDWYSGTGVPGIPGVDDDHELVVSFGRVERYAVEQIEALRMAVGLTSRIASLCPYIDRPIWDRSFWGQEFPRNHGFVIGEIFSTHFCERITSSQPWGGVWPHRPWRAFATWDRRLPLWKMRVRSWPKSWAVWDWPSDGKEPGEKAETHASGTWNDINACYGTPRAVIWEGVKWGDPWGADVGRQELEILERWQHSRACQAQVVSPGVPSVSGRGLLALTAQTIHERGWRKHPWQSRCWIADPCPCSVASLHSLAAAPADIAVPQSASACLLAVKSAEARPKAPQCGSASCVMLAGAPLHDLAWKKRAWASRPWSGYLAKTSIRSETA